MSFILPAAKFSQLPVFRRHENTTHYHKEDGPMIWWCVSISCRTQVESVDLLYLVRIASTLIWVFRSRAVRFRPQASHNEDPLDVARMQMLRTAGISGAMSRNIVYTMYVRREGALKDKLPLTIMFRSSLMSYELTLISKRCKACSWGIMWRLYRVKHHSPSWKAGHFSELRVCLCCTRLSKNGCPHCLVRSRWSDFRARNTNPNMPAIPSTRRRVRSVSNGCPQTVEWGKSRPSIYGRRDQLLEARTLAVVFGSVALLSRTPDLSAGLMATQQHGGREDGGVGPDTTRTTTDTSSSGTIKHGLDGTWRSAEVRAS
ncbi:hypothetical protein K438DRAFT_1784656 [Mycena galopus ATCC 62051]|nr:hypothetical protein K438DRAFT_1784656 [Mycena galopus ATCC 62051]